uniref:Uncharacterized protein n=1 Tax=Arundo donax TaxID=35708 RepID=A0A0A9HMH4_ARUDO
MVYCFLEVHRSMAMLQGLVVTLFAITPLDQSCRRVEALLATNLDDVPRMIVMLGTCVPLDAKSILKI